MQYEITKTLHTETAHRLINYEGKCAHLHGHRYVWEATVGTNTLDAHGFVIDYGDLKRCMQNSIGTLDHAAVFHREDPILEAGALLNPQSDSKPTGAQGRIYRMHFNPSAENLLRWQSEQLTIQLAELHRPITLTRLRVWETANSYAELVFAP